MVKSKQKKDLRKYLTKIKYLFWPVMPLVFAVLRFIEKTCTNITISANRLQIALDGFGSPRWLYVAFLDPRKSPNNGLTAHYRGIFLTNSMAYVFFRYYVTFKGKVING
jgi:hypothetical protein